ncbi:glycosyltransferase family 2 protein [Planctomycetota bacterium]|nr:glycosyltransferase family 2 protein [Planctomycetota bacterium]
MSQLGVSLVVPNYNGRDLLLKNIPTLLAAAETYPGPAEVVVVDDGSADDSVEVMRSQLGGARLVVHPQNRGFGPACKTGVEAAGHPIAILLNSDVTVEPDFVGPLVTHFERDAEVFSVSPLILDNAGAPSGVTVNLPSVRRGELKWKGVDPQDLLALAKLPAEVALEIPSLFGLGGAVALVRERFLALGGFDPMYEPFYHEDVDLGLMAWRRGWKVLVEPRSKVTHEDGGTIGKHFQPYRVKVLRRRHRILCNWKHAEGAWRSGLWKGTLVRFLTRWAKLDFRWYAAWFKARKKRAEADAARERELAATTVPLAQVFPQIVAAWPPAQLR